MIYYVMSRTVTGWQWDCCKTIGCLHFRPWAHYRPPLRALPLGGNATSVGMKPYLLLYQKTQELQLW